MKRFLPSACSLGLAISLVLHLPPSAEAQNQTVPCHGRVLLREGRGVIPLTTGRVGASDERGQMYESAAIQQDGTYQLNLRANQRSVVQVLIREYNFEPSRAVFFPGQNRQIPDFIASPRTEGRIEVGVKPHAKSTTNASLDDQRFLVTDADTGRQIATFRLDRQGRFRVNALEGTKILIEAQPNRNLQWIPPRFTTTITRSPQKTEFVYLHSSEVGTGNLNLAKDRTNVPDVIDVSLKSVDLNGGKYIVGDQVELQARPGGGVPPDARYSFLVRYDNERNFRTLVNLQRGTSVRFTLDRPGGFESKVALSSHGAILGGATIRNYAVASPNDKAPGVKHNEPEGGFWLGLTQGLPEGWHMDLRFTIDQVAGPVRQPRHLKLDAWIKSDEDSYRMPREGRRLTFLVRHEDDRQWTIVHRNVPTLEWSWTPPRQGKWTLRVDYVKPEELQTPDGHQSHDLGGRAQISFTATGPSAVSSSSSGLAAETPPPSRPGGFRPFATPTPRPTLRPAPIATPKATPRPILRPVATPKPQTPSRPALRPFSKPTPTPAPRPIRLPIGQP